MIKEVDNIILFGTSHVQAKVKEELKYLVEYYSPEVVAVELDYNRLEKLLNKNENKGKSSMLKQIREVGVFGYFFAKVAGNFQASIGSKLNIEPGVDMISAYKLARKRKIATALIDQDIRKTLKQLSKIPLYKKVLMFLNIIFKSFKKEYRKNLSFDPKRGVPSEKFISSALEIMRKELPQLYDILIHKRNLHMVKRIEDLQKNHAGKILVVIGAGHLQGMYRELIKDKSSFNSFEIKFKSDID